MRSTNPYIEDATFKQRHEHTARTNMPRGAVTPGAVGNT